VRLKNVLQKVKKACCAKSENKDLVVNPDINQPSTNSNVISVSTIKDGETISENEIKTSSGEISVEPIEKSEKSSL